MALAARQRGQEAHQRRGPQRGVEIGQPEALRVVAVLAGEEVVGVVEAQLAPLAQQPAVVDLVDVAGGAGGRREQQRQGEPDEAAQGRDSRNMRMRSLRSWGWS